MAYVAFSNISTRLWLGDNAIWHICQICQSKKSIKFLFRLINLLLLQKIFKNFQSGTIWHIVLSRKKKNKTAFELHFTSQIFYPETTLSSILYKFPRRALSIFFSIYTILNEFESGTIRVDHIVLLKKWSIFVKSTYGLNYVAFSNISRNFISRSHTILTISFNQKLFYFKYFLKTPVKNNTS